MCFRILSIYLLLIFSVTLYGQKNHDANHDISRLGSSSSFDNVVLNNQPDQNQRNVTICSFTNGWLFAAYTHILNNVEYVTVLKSVDNGHNWILLSDVSTDTPSWRFKKLQMVSCGSDTSNLYLLFSMSIYDTGGGFYLGFVDRFNVNTISWEGDILNDNSREIYDISIAGDDIFPATGSNPCSIAVVYFKRYQHDSIYYCVSGNGGQSFTTRRNIAGTNKKFGKVCLSYGRSLSYPNGRYFAAWEEKETDTSLLGHIYTSHSEPNFNSIFTTPVCVDIVDPAMDNRVRHPAIATQSGSFDNDNSDLTTVITFEQYKETDHNFNIGGCFNKKGVTGSSFQSFSLNANGHNKLTPDIAFNPYDSAFVLTYFDSTDFKLPFLFNSFNLLSPGNWNFLSQGFNINLNLSSPKPSIRIDHSLQNGMVSWIEEGSSGNGIAMFSSPLLYPVGIQNESTIKDSLTLKLYPNPTSALLVIDLQLFKPHLVNLSIFNEYSNEIFAEKMLPCKLGYNFITIDVSSYPKGMYFLTITCGENHTTKKFIVK